MQEYFTPIDVLKFNGINQYTDSSYGKVVNAYTQDGNFPELKDVDLAIVGIQEDRKAINNEGCGLSPDYIRENFYKLFQGNFNARIVDLGNIKKGNTIEDSYFAVTDVLSQLLKKNIVPITIGGGQDLT